MKKSILFKLVGSVLLMGILYVCMLQGKIMYYGKTVIPENADFMIILGTKVNGKVPSETLQYRINTAAKYLKENKSTVAIASGAKGPDEGIPEALAIKNALIKQGIEKERIIMEVSSTRTVENIAYSKELLPKGSQNGLVVSNFFHIYRARLIASDQGLDLKSLPAETPQDVLAKWYVREYLAITKYYVERLMEVAQEESSEYKR
ncbi:YdcF family protein [[Brevibacterium] frigoritolerans]|nr:YdcF family protein [Peribacillus frigoritolerans]